MIKYSLSEHAEKIENTIIFCEKGQRLGDRAM